MLEIFQYDFMVRAFIAGTITGVIAPIIGSFLVVRRLSLMAETLAHVSLLGVAIGLFAGVQPVITATATAVLASLGIEKIRTGKKIFGESALALFFSGSLAVASILMSLSNGFRSSLFSFLFGSVTTVTQTDLVLIAVLALILVAAVFFTYKELFLVSFDEELAQTGGINARLINLILVILAAITVSLSIRIVGILLIGALMIIPVVTAVQIAKSFKQVLAYSIVASLLSVISGLFISYYLDLPSGGTIVCIALGLFLISLIASRKS
ncbi:MAG: metal ABC transporter permease [Candidatus Gracilibacteria bacterium]|nr:metal ABC transporter permease [Candidatus Peregrinibacteria bacterium]